MGNLGGKVAVVTGASKGMGRHFVDRLVEAGVKVACLARQSSELEAIASAHNESVLVIPCDVSRSDEVDAAVRRAKETFGRIDVLVNNAAIFEPFAIEHGSDDQVERHISLNVLGVIWMTRACIPHLRETGGQVITVSSESVRHPFPMLSVYAATKAAVETLSTALRDELQSENIRVSVLRSGSVAGSAGSSNWPAGAAEAFFKKISQTGHAAMAGEAATPQSMAEALLSVIGLPKDVNADLIEVRAARAGVPDAVKALDAQAS